MPRDNYIGVILAGGKGTRMQPFSEAIPKPLLPICNKPILQYQIETLRDLGIFDIVILIGHKGYEIVRALGDGKHLGVRLRYVEQRTILGIAHAVRQLEDHIDRPFLLFLGDIFFKSGDLDQMFFLFEQQGGGAVLATRDNSDPAEIRKNYAIVLDEQGYAKRVVEKPRHTVNRLKGVGLYLFDLTIFDAIRRTPRTALRDEYEITDAIQVLIQDGLPVRPCNAILEDINLTTPADILRCNLMYAEETFGFHQTPTPRLDGAARFQKCVVGNDVSVRHGITIRNSVIFANTRVDARADLENFVITPDFMVDCTYAMR